MYVNAVYYFFSNLLGFAPFRQYVVNPSWEAAKVGPNSKTMPFLPFYIDTYNSI